MKCEYCLKKTTNLDHKCKSQIIQPPLDNVKNKIIELLNQGYATSYIANNSIELLGFPTTNDRLIFFCRRHSIKRRTIKDAANSKVTRDLYKHTVKNKYGEGIINISQVDQIKEKKKTINLARYGVINQFQRLEIKEKSKQTMLEKYGVENSAHIPNRKHSNGRLSKPHKKVSDFLNSIGVDHNNDLPGKFHKFNDTLGRNYCPIPDIYIPNKNLVIEIYGDRWHMNPKIYNPTDIIRFFIGERTAKECWEFDRIRIDHLISFGITAIIIWESDIKQNFSVVQQTLREAICGK